jgi:hypothetical protein
MRASRVHATSQTLMPITIPSRTARVEVEPDYRERDFQFEAPGIRVNVCAGHGRGNIARETGGTRMKAMYVDWGRLLLGRRDCACRGRQWEGEHCKVTENDFRANTPHLPPPFSHFLIVKKTPLSQLLPPTICFHLHSFFKCAPAAVAASP